jgi:hypothetical protein
MIAKDFHSVKDFRQIRGKSFVIMVGVAASAGFSGHSSQVFSCMGDGRALRRGRLTGVGIN